jgi:methylmalonyl-CoA/ethylmalonyl-CoA epimerase
MLAELECQFHHLGVACRTIEREAQIWSSLGYEREGDDFEDPIQKVRGRFIVGPGPRLELLTPTAPDSPVAGVLERGVKIYHQAFVTPRFDATVAALIDSGNRVTAGPSPAIAFGGRRIAFFLMPNMNLIEIIEA